MTAEQIVRAYYAAFNANDHAAFLDLLTEDVAHDINQGGREVGRAAFASFLQHMDHCYRERVEDLVVLTEPTGTRAAAEFTIHGTYLRTDEGFPEAHGQTYMLPVCAAFTLRDGKVARISNFYNVNDWRAQIEA
jgi:steroid delta-isomerase-like uncharacterized protein